MSFEFITFTPRFILDSTNCHYQSMFDDCDGCYPSHTVKGKALAHSANSIAVSKGTLDD